MARPAIPAGFFANTFIIPLPASGASYRSAPADIHAFNVVTGAFAWVFHTVPRQGEFGADTWPAESLATAGGVHNWSEMTVDEERGIAFIPTGTARYDFYGGNRHGDNLFANSLLALDARTGKRLWHFQTIHHDLWDYDLAAAPKMLTIVRDGKPSMSWRRRPSTASSSCSIATPARRSGRSRSAPSRSPMCPASSRGRRSRSRLRRRRLLVSPSPRTRSIRFLPEEEQLKLRARFPDFRNEGLFTPPSFQGTIQMPGSSGGANWGSAAVNPADGTLFIVSKELPALLKLAAPAAGQGGREAPAAGLPYRRRSISC